MDEDEITRRKTPPEKESEWAHLWEGVDKAHKGWTVTGPIYAAVTNWKAWVAIAAIVAFLNKPELTDAITLLLGAE